MAKEVTQIIDSKDENYDGYGSITVIATDEDGRQSVSTNSYGPSSRESTLESTIQETLNK